MVVSEVCNQKSESTHNICLSKTNDIESNLLGEKFHALRPLVVVREVCFKVYVHLIHF